MSIALFLVGGVLTASGLYMLFFRSSHDSAPGSEMKVGDMRVSSSKPSLFLIGAGIIVLIIAAKLYSDQRQMDQLNEMLRPYQ